MRSIFAATAALTSLTMTAPAMADHHGAMDHSKMDHSVHGADQHIKMVLADERRAEDAVRDQYRHPAETLAFFQITPDQTVAEYGPGGGWYTRVLAPYLADNGQYVAIDGDSDGRTYNSPEAEENTRSWPQRFPSVAAGWTGVDAAKIMAFESDEVPEGIAGTVDRVLIFRSIHGLLNGNRADSELRNIRAMLADDGMVGVVQHRAKDDQPYEMTNGSRGYIKQDDVVALFRAHGFELVGASEINANPNDSVDHERGVWEMPPVWATKRDELKDLGESDRMTLLFRKAK